jgi:hypothetical protein
MTSLDWELDAAPPVQPSGPSPTTPTSRFSSLSLEAGGGSLSGGASLTLLKYANCDPQEGGTICTFLKGKDKRTICLVRKCTKQSHKNAGREGQVDFGGVDELLIIQTGVELGLSRPTIFPKHFGANLERYMVERRSVDAWVALLEQTKLHELSAEEVDQVADTLDEKTVQRRLYTPWKKRKVERAVGPSPSESAASFQDITFVPPMEDLGDADAPNLVLSNLAMEWPGLVRNLTTLHKMVATAKRGNKEVASVLNEEVQTISGQLLRQLYSQRAPRLHRSRCVRLIRR